MSIAYDTCGNTSIVATIKGKDKGRVVALRCDIDALPVKEESSYEHPSEIEGMMHACGHDTHIAMLLGAAKVLNEHKDSFKGTVKLIFQEAEETFKGARKVCESKLVDDVDAFLAIHNMPLLKVGTADINTGYKAAGCDTIYVKFEGVSGHGSAPHLAKDTIGPLCDFINALQTIATKNVDPKKSIVLTPGRMDGGTKANIIAKNASVDISMRYFDKDVRETVHKAIKRHAEAIALANEIKVEGNIEESTLSVKNSEDIVDIAKKSADQILEGNYNIDTGMAMGSEDFAYYLDKAPGVFIWMGSGNEEKDAIYYPHHEKFKVDEDFLVNGAALHVQFAMDYLNNNGK